MSGQEAARAFPGTAAKMLSGSTNSAVFPRKEKAAEAFEKGIRRWLFRHQNVTGILRVFEHLWQHHEQFKLNRFDYGKISSIQKMTSGMIWHCEDHHPNRAMVYCPALYHDMLTKTFLASDIFQEVSQGVANLLHDQREDAQRRFRKTYPWAFRATVQTPYAFALPKRKKDFLSGRPIISFVKAFMRPLLEATARLVFQLTAVSFPESFASGDVYDLLARVQQYFRALQNPACAFDLQDLGCRNQDLPGFFTSVSREQFFAAWKLLLSWYHHKQGAKHDTTFTVDLRETQQVLCIFRGVRRRRAKQQVSLQLADVPDIINHALNMTIFGVHTRAIRQIRGSPMGSPLSPALCSMVIASLESVWKRTFQLSVRNMDLHTFLRYVDNRLLFAPESFLKLPCMQLLQRMDFYGQAIILEDEEEYDFLGFHIDYPQGRIRYCRSLQDADLLHPLSAAPSSILLSGLLSRAFVIKKCGYPTAQVERDLHFLWDLANKRGLPVHDAKFKSRFFRLKR